MTHACVGTKRGERGVVWRPDGQVIGRVSKHARVAAGMGGSRASFYTANVAYGAGYTGTSLGTRHKTRAGAVRAIRMFWEWYEAEGFTQVGTLEALTRKFKRQHPAVCAVTR